MDAIQTLGLLSEYSVFEEDQVGGKQAVPTYYTPATPEYTSPKVIPEITKAKKSGGDIRLLKTVITSACERNCNYCAFRAGRDFRRATLKPDEMAQLFHQMYIAGVAEGLFLSSGLAGGGVRTQDRLIDTAEILRNKFKYRGYLHLKIMPGAERDQVLRAMQLASRVSINLEAPNPVRLEALAPRKSFLDELMQPLRWVEELRGSYPPSNPYHHRWPSLATQFVVGSVGESDLELLSLSEYLFQKLKLARIYYSKFSPVQGTPFENLPPEKLLRQNRLYQASFLLKEYGYTSEEMNFQANGNLPLDEDPKLSWAKANLHSKPVEINTADRLQLLRVPGIGPKGVDAILETRVRNPIKEIGDLRRLGINPDRALDFILLNGKHPNQQMRLF